MSIKFYPSHHGYVDLVLIKTSNWIVKLSFFPVYCWSWEWNLIQSCELKAAVIETPTMTIKINPQPKPDTSA